MWQEKILFEKALHRLIFYWKFTGVQIDYDKEQTKQTMMRTIRKRWFYIANFFMVTYGAFSFTLKVLNKEMILYQTPCMTFCVLGDLKSFYFIYYQDKVYDIINTLRYLQSISCASDYTNILERKDEANNDFVKKRLPFLNAVNRIILAIYSMAVATFCVGPLVIISWQYWSTNEIKLFLPFVNWYPFDEYSYGGWFFAYLYQIWAAWLTAFFIYGPDSFFYLACTFIHNQLCLLQFDIRNIGPKSFANKDSINMHFKGLIYRHNEIIRCVNNLSVIYGISTLFNVLSSSFIICLTGLNVTSIDNLILMAPFAQSLIVGCIQIFMFCYYGDLIRSASMEVSCAVFDSEWYELDAVSMKKCLFILMRAQNPCKITAYGFSDINLVTFARIISSAWSYFTLFKSMLSK